MLEQTTVIQGIVRVTIEKNARVTITVQGTISRRLLQGDCYRDDHYRGDLFAAPGHPGDAGSAGQAGPGHREAQ